MHAGPLRYVIETLFFPLCCQARYSNPHNLDCARHFPLASRQPLIVLFLCIFVSYNPDPCVVHRTMNILCFFFQNREFKKKVPQTISVFINEKQ